MNTRLDHDAFATVTSQSSNRVPFSLLTGGRTTFLPRRNGLKTATSNCQLVGVEVLRRFANSSSDKISEVVTEFEALEDGVLAVYAFDLWSRDAKESVLKIRDGRFCRQDCRP